MRTKRPPQRSSSSAGNLSAAKLVVDNEGRALVIVVVVVIVVFVVVVVVVAGGATVVADVVEGVNDVSAVFSIANTRSNANSSSSMSRTASSAMSNCDDVKRCVFAREKSCYSYNVQSSSTITKHAHNDERHAVNKRCVMPNSE